MNLREDVTFHLVNGIRYAVREFSVEGAAPREPERTVLLLHGFLDSGATWDLVAPHLAVAGFRVLAPDLRGFGDSGRVPLGGYYYFADYIADVAALVDLLAPKDLSVVGHSMGGGVASLFTGVYPERVRRIPMKYLSPNLLTPLCSITRSTGGWSLKNFRRICSACALL